MKQTNNDIYDLNSTSPKGQIGFEPFRTDKHYYFHFNNEDGDCILFSQAYKSKKGADNGMESIKKNIRHKDHVLLHHNDDLHYFTIKAGNNQEVARSRNFDTFEDMERGLHFLYNQLGCTYESQYSNREDKNELIEITNKNESLRIQLKEKTEIEKELREKLWELETALAETTNSLNESLLNQDEWSKEKSVLEKKLVLLTKKISDLDTSPSEELEVVEEFQGSTYGFRIDFYNIDTAEDVKVTIYQPLSREKKVMKGLQKDAIFEFITNRLPSTIVEESIEEEFDEIAVKAVTENSKKIHGRSVMTRVATKRIPSIQETVEPADLAVTVEEITPEESEVETLAESLVETIESPIIKKKVRTIYQMKEMVEDIRKRMATKEPTPPPIKKAVPPATDPEELALRQSAEEITTIEEFFGSVEATNSLPEEELEPVEYLTEEVETIDETEIEEQTIRQFFPPQIEKEAVERPADIVSRASTKAASPDLSEEELEIVQRFFPSKYEEPRTAPLKLSEIQTLLDNATAEDDSVMSKEDIAVINQFFPTKSIEKVVTQSRSTIKVALPESQNSIHKAESETVSKFFGKKQRKVAMKSKEETQNEIVADILSNIKEGGKTQGVDNELVKKFFGEKTKKAVKKPAKARSLGASKKRPMAKEYQFNQRADRKASVDDVALFNKWFGK